MAGEAVTAASMARAARYDPQFAVPRRPRVRRGVAVRRYPDALLVDGAPTRHVLRGRAAADLVPRMLPLLDGRRGHDALAERLGVSTAAVFTALSLLWTCGVVEEAAPPDVDAGWVPEPLADYLSRMGDSTAANAAWEQAAARLAAGRVELHGDPRLRATLAAELGGSLPLLATGGAGPGPDCSTVVLLETDGTPADPALVDECWRRGLPVLRVRLSGTEVELGPYVDPLLTPCLSCLAGATDGEDGAAPESDPEPARDPDPQSARGEDADADRMLLAAGLAATDLVGLLSRATRAGLPVRWRRIRLDRFTQSTRTGATRPGCPRCSAAPSPAPRLAPLSARYEAAVALPPKRYADAKAHQVHYQPANVALQRGHKTWPLAPRRPLPAPDLDRLTDPTGAAADGGALADLALLLAIGAGWQGEQAERVWRWTASGGNIGSVVAHLLVRDVPGLSPGAYGYLPAGHELALLRPAGYGWPGGCPCGAPACLVLTADLARVAQKYGAFGLRVVLLDAGCAHAALLEVAGRLGLRAVADPGFDDARLADLLGTDPEAEPVTGLVHLDRPEPLGGAR